MSEIIVKTQKKIQKIEVESDFGKIEIILSSDNSIEDQNFNGVTSSFLYDISNSMLEELLSLNDEDFNESILLLNSIRKEYQNVIYDERED